MVARVRDAAGEPTGGIHRTYLLDDGSGKAPPGKKMLGPIAGGSVRLSTDRRGRSSRHRRRHRDSARRRRRSSAFRPGRRSPLTACGNGNGRRASTRVTIFADAGNAGAQAAAVLAERLTIAGIANTIVSPLHGDDFNDDLRRGARRRGLCTLRTSRLRPSSRARRRVRSPVRALTRPPDLQALGSVLGQTCPGPAGAIAGTAGACCDQERDRNFGRDPGKAGRRAASAPERDRRHPSAVAPPAMGEPAPHSISPAHPSATKPTSSPRYRTTRHSPARWCSTSSARRSW